MTTTENSLDIQNYIAMGLRRKWYIIIPLVLSVVASIAVYKKLPKIYKATTLILVQSQRIPTEYVRSTITDTVSSQLNTLSQEILSRTRLEKVINEFNLYADLIGKHPMEVVVETMRNAIVVTIQSQPQYERGQNSFSISFEGKEPRTVMLVTNKLASLFIEENLKVREQQAEKTSDFLSKELSMMEDKLRGREVEIRAFKERHMGQLPEQLDANLRILERLQEQLKTTSENTRAAEDRAILVRGQIDQLKEREQGLLARQTRRESTSRGSTPNAEDASSDQTIEDPIITQYNQLKRDLTAAQSNYTENHPDVIALKKKIARLEPRVKETMEKQTTAREARLRALRERRDTGTGIDPAVAVLDPVLERQLAQYTEQYNESQLEAKRLKVEEKSLKDQIALYQRRIEDTPRGEQELALLTRDYDLTKENYQSLMDKKIQARMAENLERNQQGEQFKILDPARIPEKPIKPNRDRILLMGLVMGLGLGAGLAWFRESLDKSFHTVADLESYLELPVLATIPNLKEEEKKAA
jgi:polysaccharide chain length determinant protein (PEP-CTERM system associated)